jgi:DNA-binding response OmpR family regulator
MEALRKGAPVMLTTMQFKTLKYLIQNARRVISRKVADVSRENRAASNALAAECRQLQLCQAS